VKKEKVKRRKWEKEVMAEREVRRWEMGKRGIDDLCLPLRLCAFATLRSIRILHSNGIHGMKAIFFRVFDVFRG
jgi:hypothetical protein